MNTVIFVSLLAFGMYLSTRQQNSGPRDSHCNLNITLNAALGFLKAVFFTYHLEYTQISEQ